MNMSKSSFTTVPNDKIDDYSEIFDELIDNIDFEVINGNANEILTADSVNDNFLNYIDQYYNETLTNSFSLNDDSTQTENPNYNIPPSLDISNADNIQLNDKLPHIFIINQSLQNINSNVEIKNSSQHFSNCNNRNATCSSVSSIHNYIDPSLKPHFGFYGSQQPTTQRRNYSTSTLMLNQYGQTKRKDENFYSRLLLLLDDEDMKKLNGEMYTLEYYRSCNKLLATKSRPLANLRHKNTEAEKKHKELVDLNKKCRSIIRKFRNGPFTIDTLFRWNEQRSIDGPMSCSICRCNKFFKRPGSIANHIYRVHEKILQEALKNGELNEIIKDNEKIKHSSQSKFHLCRQAGLTFTQSRNQFIPPKINLPIYQTNRSNDHEYNHLTSPIKMETIQQTAGSNVPQMINDEEANKNV